jgi:nitronate monooxygenase
MRTGYALNSARRLEKSLMTDDTSSEYWQAGKSVAGIHEVKPAAQIAREFAAALDSSEPTSRPAVRETFATGRRAWTMAAGWKEGPP